MQALLRLLRFGGKNRILKQSRETRHRGQSPAGQAFEKQPAVQRVLAGAALARQGECGFGSGRGRKGGHGNSFITGKGILIPVKTRIQRAERPGSLVNRS